jgi:hypothetical protein
VRSNPNATWTDDPSVRRPQRADDLLTDIRQGIAQTAASMATQPAPPVD